MGDGTSDDLNLRPCTPRQEEPEEQSTLQPDGQRVRRRRRRRRPRENGASTTFTPHPTRSCFTGLRTQAKDGADGPGNAPPGSTPSLPHGPEVAETHGGRSAPINAVTSRLSQLYGGVYRAHLKAATGVERAGAGRVDGSNGDKGSSGSVAPSSAPGAVSRTEDSQTSEEACPQAAAPTSVPKRRALTIRSAGLALPIVKMESDDEFAPSRHNEKNDIVLFYGDAVYDNRGTEYIVRQRLGFGSFGQVRPPDRVGQNNGDFTSLSLSL